MMPYNTVKHCDVCTFSSIGPNCTRRESNPIYLRHELRESINQENKISTNDIFFLIFPMLQGFVLRFSWMSCGHSSACRTLVEADGSLLNSDWNSN